MHTCWKRLQQNFTHLTFLSHLVLQRFISSGLEMLTGGVFLHSVALCRTLNFVLGWMICAAAGAKRITKRFWEAMQIRVCAKSKVPEPDLDAVEAEKQHILASETCLQQLNVHRETNTSVFPRYVVVEWIDAVYRLAAAIVWRPGNWELDSDSSENGRTGAQVVHKALPKSASSVPETQAIFENRNNETRNATARRTRSETAAWKLWRPDSQIWASWRAKFLHELNCSFCWSWMKKHG